MLPVPCTIPLLVAFDSPVPRTHVLCSMVDTPLLSATADVAVVLCECQPGKIQDGEGAQEDSAWVGGGMWPTEKCYASAWLIVLVVVLHVSRIQPGHGVLACYRQLFMTVVTSPACANA